MRIRYAIAAALVTAVVLVITGSSFQDASTPSETRGRLHSLFHSARPGPARAAHFPGRQGDASNADQAEKLNSPVAYDFVSIDYPTAPETVFDGINDHGWIAGWFNFTPASSPVGDTPVLYRDGGFQVINIPGSTGGRAVGINKKGHVVGAYEDAGGSEHGFEWDDGKLSTIDFPGALLTGVQGINDSNQIAGAYLEASGNLHAFLLSGGAFTTLDFPGAAGFTSALGINNLGEIVGEYKDAGGIYRGYLYSGGSFISIDFPGAVLTAAAGVNDKGEIAGWYDDANHQGHGFTMRAGSFTSVDPPGATDVFLVAVNNKGRTVGAARDAQGEYHSLLATPSK